MTTQERMIAFIKERPEIYDINNKAYHDFELKEAIWREIGQKLGKTPNVCKKQWTTLRDSFRRSLKKRKESNVYKKWRFEEEMAFVVPHFRDREVTDNFNSYMDSCAFVLQPLKDDSDDPLYAHPTTSKDETGSPFPSSPMSDDNFESEPKRIKVEEITISDATGSEVHERAKRRCEDTGELDLFFSSIAATVKKFSAYHQAIAKAKVFAVISELEIEEAKKIDGEK